VLLFVFFAITQGRLIIHERTIKLLLHFMMLQLWDGTSTAGPNRNPGTRASLNQMRMRDAATPYMPPNPNDPIRDAAEHKKDGPICCFAILLRFYRVAMKTFMPPVVLQCLLAVVMKTLAFAVPGTNEMLNWPEKAVKLSGSGSLGELFDAGLRPYRFPRMEASQLEFKHLRISLVQADGIILPTFTTEWADVSVLHEGMISTMVMSQPPMNLAACRAEMLHWIPFGNNPKRTVAELDAFLKAVEDDYREYNVGPNAITHDFRLAWKDAAGLKYVVWLQPALQPEKPLRVQMQVAWPRSERQKRTLYESPIPPPPGYEHVDMTAPKDFGPDSSPVDPEVERVMKEGRMPDYSQLEYPHLSIRVAPKQDELGGWIRHGWPLAAGLAFLVCIVLLLLRQRKKSSR
jgi:hypothetical protein